MYVSPYILYIYNVATFTVYNMQSYTCSSTILNSTTALNDVVKTIDI